MNDKQRAEFELWCESKGYCTNRSERYGDYITGYTDELWQAWQAAIASVKALSVATYEKSEPIYLNKEFVKD